MKPFSKSLILYNANVLTLNPYLPRADWVAVHDGEIAHLGFGKDWANLTECQGTHIDLEGQTVVPGFIDAHMHIVATAKKHLSLDLAPGKNIRCFSDIVSFIHDHSRHVPAGAWVFGKGHNEHYLSEKTHPNRWDLDRAAPDHPIKITHRSGHTHVLNTLALQKVGINRESGDPNGGIIDRDLKSGEPTGILYGMGDFLSERIPPPQKNELEAGLKKVNQMLLSVGVTSIQDASHRNDLRRWDLLKNWSSCGKLQPRVNMLQGYPSFLRKEHHEFSTLPEQNRFKIGAVKIIVDDTTGRILPEQKDLNEMVLNVHQAGVQAAFHAINEVSIDAACRSVASALAKLPGKNFRHRIEHCSVCPPALAKKIARLNMSVVTQPSFIFHSGERYIETVPEEQLQFLYPMQTLLSHGINLAASSDSPVVPPDPLTGIYAAVTRSAENDLVVGRHEKISALEALRMYTRYAAYTTFEEDIKGTISPGKLADIVVLNEDPTRLSDTDLRKLKVNMTIIGGEIVWDKNSSVY